MKICLINNLYPPYSKGGAEGVVENTARGLIKVEHNLIITLGRKDVCQMSNVKCQVYRLNPWNIFSYLDIDKKPIILRLIWWFFNIFNFSSNRKIKKILLKEKPDVVHSHNLCGIGFLIPHLIKKLKIKHIHTLHDIQLAYPSGQLIYGKENSFKNRFFLRVWYEKLIRRLFNSPDVIISPSKWLMEFYDKRGFFRKSKKEIIANPIIFKETKKLKAQLSSRGRGMVAKATRNKETINYENKEIQFIFVGRVEKYKGILFLIKTFNELRIMNHELWLNIVGNGKDFEKARDLAHNNDKIIFHGTLDKEQLNKLYKQCDVLILPTLTYENQPTVILEAFSFGLPVVASKIGGIPELIDDKCDWLFEPGNCKELTKIIKNLIENPHEIKKTAQNLNEQIERHKLENYILKLENIYKK